MLESYDSIRELGAFMLACSVYVVLYLIFFGE